MLRTYDQIRAERDALAAFVLDLHSLWMAYPDVEGDPAEVVALKKRARALAATLRSDASSVREAERG